jgi:trk system potassium uptake protein TrkH
MRRRRHGQVPASQRLSRAAKPASYVALGLAGLISVGTLLLSLPAARSGPDSSPFINSFFTAVSASTVTGLSSVDTATYWSGFGEVVILLLVQAGGFGISTGAALVTILVFRQLGLRARLYTSTATGNIDLGDVRKVVRGVAVISLSVEAMIALMLTARWWLGYDEPFGTALWYGVFHAVTSFNNAGFTLFSDSLIGYAADPLILVPISAAIILGSIGVPVLFEVFRRHRQRFSLHARVTIWVSALLTAYGMVALIVMEWTNPATLGDETTPVKLLTAWFQGVSSRTAGFNSVDYAGMQPESLLVTDTLMFVGGGSVSTAGGIRVTTLAVLFLILLAQARGDRDTIVGGRRLGQAVVQQALVVTVVFAMLAVAGTVGILMLSDTDLDHGLFEVISAVATTGLSTGITGGLDGPAQVLLTVLMFMGRVGPLTLATAVALRQRDARYRYPEGRVLIG